MDWRILIYTADLHRDAHLVVEEGWAFLQIRVSRQRDHGTAWRGLDCHLTLSRVSTRQHLAYDALKRLNSRADRRRLTDSSKRDQLRASARTAWLIGVHICHFFVRDLTCMTNARVSPRWILFPLLHRKTSEIQLFVWSDLCTSDETRNQMRWVSDGEMNFGEIGRNWRVGLARSSTLYIAYYLKMLYEIKCFYNWFVKIVFLPPYQFC